jgi:hypothetical protein
MDKPKLCINCKFYKKDFFSSSEFGKCILFPMEEENKYYYVNGKEIKNKNYYYCSIVRNFENKCGKEGLLFEKKKNLWEK